MSHLQMPTNAVNNYEQISVNRELNRITFWSVVVTAVAASVGLVGLYFISETLKATKIQAEAAKIQAQAAETSVKIAAKSIEETVKNFQLDQRAWVGPLEIQVPKIAAGTFKIEVILINTGKTPALNLKPLISWKFIYTRDKLSPTYERFEGVQSAVILHPGMRTGVLSTEIPFSQERIDAIKAGNLTFYFFGKYTYEDTFRIKREGTFCGHITRTFERFLWCPTYNESK